MKKQTLIGLTLALAFVNQAPAQTHPATNAPPPPEPVPIYLAPPASPAPAGPAGERMVYVYDQRPLQSMPSLISAEEGQGIVERFRSNYVRLENPRILIYVNRNLVGEQSGLRVASRTENIETTETSTTATNTDAKPGPVQTNTRIVAQNSLLAHEDPGLSLADRQTVRDVERLFGRPLRLAGASLVDQAVATQLIGNRPLGDLTAVNEGQQAGKDREVLGKIADIVLEVLITSRNVTVPEVSGDRTYSVPDIQTTAIRLRDSKVIGQASAADIMSRGHSAGYTARNFSVADITEATALALMEDILQGMQAR